MTSQCRAIRSQSRKLVKLVKIMSQTFSNCESTCDLTDIRASIYDRKTRPDLLTLSTTFYDLSVPRNLFSNVKIRQLGASGTEGSTYQNNLKNIERAGFRTLGVSCIDFNPATTAPLSHLQGASERL